MLRGAAVRLASWKAEIRVLAHRQGGGPAVPALEMSPDDVLDAVARLPISTWRYAFEPSVVRHMGPMSQDFYAAFGLGLSDRTIRPLDANGVTLVALQALTRRVAQLERELQDGSSAPA